MSAGRRLADGTASQCVSVKMETLDFEVRFETDATNQSPGRLTGILLRYEQRAKDRAELFAAGSLHWPDGGIIIRISSMIGRDLSCGLCPLNEMGR